ncbi:16S rRNA (cytidine(1402)-2'-O)-methyltransferase [Longibacter salinarum]|uniref:Ribosomal RNA small subunit methyltransferase I n=1 Tax=Longibacter salinarum TaxID=1850348 RepID=A0A2A8D0G4_9BACT|nr:16S rRNA (cytidine(1402)-2'-O)-methyltransferase [Longibacter salinarum]PEN14374.1 16S rRNA (cytidine(1402)-2'-O)-methyltransferase [Longibacter salinarum]
MLYLVPTPIGNLEDVTIRAIRVLRESDLIACEDTRTSGVFLSKYGIDTPTTSYHDHNEREKAPQLVKRMRAGHQIALITDAGAPGISDPGFFLVRAAHRAGVDIQALPGPTAFVPALTASALPCDRFVFEGFLPKKKGRQTRIKTIASEPRTVVFYESPHRLLRTLDDLIEQCGPERPVAVARELTKTYEEIERGTLREVHSYFAGYEKVRGEIVIVLGGADA